MPKAINRPITELFAETANTYADSTAIHLPDHSLSFRDVNKLSDNIAASLFKQGVRKGDRIGLYCSNGAEFAIAYLGIVKAGGVVIPINLLLTPGEISYILNDGGAKGLIFHNNFAQQKSAFFQEVDSLEFSIRIAGDVGADEIDWNECISTPGAKPTIAISPTDDLVCILYTSGTTGKPKGAMLTHTNLATNTTSASEALDIIPGQDRVLVVLPMFHAFAATVGMLVPLLHGAALIPVLKFEPKLVAETIDQHQASIFLGVPSMYNVLLQNVNHVAPRFKSIRHCISGGASMPKQLMKDFEAAFDTFIYEGDGPTECSPVTCINPIGGVRKKASVGLPIPEVDMAIFDAEGQQLPNNTIGEICVRAASVMKGYWNNPQATAESFFGEWFRTGDLGNRDDDGYFYIVDRIKDMIIVNGMNVYPRTIEEVLYQHPEIMEAAVIGEPDSLHGEIVIAHIAPVDGKTLTAQQVRSFCRDLLGRYQIPKKYIFHPSLPKNAAGKILKRELRRHGEVERGIDTAVH